MEKVQYAEIKEPFKWEKRSYEEYISRYKLYKRLKRKWDAIETEQTSDACSKTIRYKESNLERQSK